MERYIFQTTDTLPDKFMTFKELTIDPKTKKVVEISSSALK
jgi:hypothetical protein